MVSASHDSNVAGDQPRSPTSSSQTFGVVEAPQDVGRAARRQPGAKFTTLVNRVDDDALVGIEVGLDQLPQRVGVGIDHRRRANDAQHRCDAGLHDARVARIQAQCALGISGLEHLAVPLPLSNGRFVGVAFENEIPQRSQQATLGGEGDVDGLQRNARLSGDGFHRCDDVAIALEEQAGGIEHRSAGGFSLLLSALRVVRPLRFRLLHRLTTLSKY